ncbi:hypothetical protein [Butyrivibrio sp.]|uniref:hypothetical protein n=1 Tax=Butyrivibrio sp. TaxID=28121 RepID=UPI0025BAC555|nr:hypothetical protein [Butyrivibrio sp.]MBQ9303166.1 hypothetical protein [Butyrivibrio sp.]
MKVKTKQYDKKRKNRKWIVAIAVIAALLFVLAGLGINSEINSLYSQLAQQRQQLNDSLDKTVTAYMETKYMGTTNGNQLTEGDLSLSDLTDEELDSIIQAVLGVVNENITDDVYTGASELAVDQLRSQIAQAIQNQLLSMGLSSATLSDEITALVLKNLESNLTDYQNQIIQNASNISSISNMAANTTTNIENLSSTIANVQKNYDASISSLKKQDEVLAAKIDSILKDSATSSSDFEKQLAALVSELASTNSSVSETNTTINNQYNDIMQQIENSQYSQANVTDDLQNQINTLQSALDSYINNGALAGTITPRTDGGSGNKLTLIVP